MKILWTSLMVVFCSASLAGTAYPAAQNTAIGDLIRQLQNAGTNQARQSAAVEAIADNPAAIDALIATGNLSLIKTYQNEAAQLYARRVKEQQQAVEQSESLVAEYQAAERSGDEEQQHDAMQKLVGNTRAVRMLVKSGELSHKTISALYKSSGAKTVPKPTAVAGMTSAEVLMDLEHTKKIAEAQRRIEDLRRAVASGDEAAQRAATMNVLDNVEARQLMKGNAVDDTLKNTYATLTDTYRTQPIMAGTADALNSETFTRPGGKPEPRFVVRGADGVERSITAADFASGTGNVGKAGTVGPPGMDLDLYPQVEIIDKKTGRKVKMAEVESAVSKSCDNLNINRRLQEVNVTGMGGVEDLKMRPGETPADFIKRIKKTQDITRYEGQVASDVMTHKLTEADNLYGDGARSSSVSQQARGLEKDMQRYIDPLLDADRSLRYPDIFTRPDPETGETALDIIKKLGRGEIPPGTASHRFKQLTGGVDLEDGMRKISSMTEFIAIRGVRKPGAFKKTWQILQDSKSLKAASKYFGEILSGVTTGGDLSRHMLNEMDRALQTGDTDTTSNIWYALARTSDTCITEPLQMFGNLLATGLEKGAIKFGQGLESIGQSIKQINQRAEEVGWFSAFGEVSGAAMVAGAQGALAAGEWVYDKTLEGGGAAWEGLKYAAANPLATADATVAASRQASLLIGDVLGLQAIGQLAFRENEMLVANTSEMRRHLIASADALAERADGLQRVITVFKDMVREEDPEGKNFKSKISQKFEFYGKEYQQLVKDYTKWRTFLDRTYGGIEHPTIADTWPNIKPRIEKIYALPARLSDVLDKNFIKGLLSTVRIGLVDAESKEKIKSGGWIQFNSQGVEIVCKGNGPAITCNDIPPGTHQMRVKVGDYEEVRRTVKIDPLSRRHYDQLIRLASEAPLWAYITVNVFDVETDVPIPGALVKFSSNAEKTRQNTTTTGALQITQVLNGDVSIRASAAGYYSNSSSLQVDTTQNTEYFVSIYLQPDGSTKVEQEAEKPKPESSSFDCNQIQLSTNVDFSTWSCCKDDFERTMVRSMCNSVKTQASSKKLTYKGLIADSIRSQEGDSFNPQADYSDYPTPYGTLREVDQCADTKAEDLCRRLGASQADEPKEEKTEKKKTNACYEKKRTLIENAIKSNSDGNPNANILIYATKACEEAHKKCKDRGYKIGEECRSKAKNMQEIKACNPPVSEYWEDCALQEVHCSAAAIRQECGVEE